MILTKDEAIDCKIISLYCIYCISLHPTPPPKINKKINK